MWTALLDCWTGCGWSPGQKPHLPTQLLPHLPIHWIGTYPHLIMFTLPPSPLTLTPSPHTIHTYCTIHLPPLHHLHSNHSLCGLYKALQSSITEHNRQKQDRPVCLVFNDFSTLVSIGVEVKQVISFVRYCYDMVTMPEEQRVVSRLVR